MKRIMSRNNPISRIDKISQMNKQEEIIARKRQEILEKHRTMILGKRVAAAQNVAGKSKSITNEDESGSPESMSTSEGKDLIDQTSTLSKIQNTFCNDGSFLTHFKKILENSEQKSCNIIEVKNQSDENVLLKKDESVKVSENLIINYNEEIQNSSNAFVYAPSICNSPLPDMYNTNNVTGSLEMPPILSQPIQSPLPDNHLNTFYNPVTIVGIPPPPPPPAILPSSATSQGTIQPLYLIPTHELLQKHTTQMDINPVLYNTELVLDDNSRTLNERVFSGNSDSLTIPTTLETLIDLVAEFGDEYEDKVRNRKNDVHPSLWFLFEKESEKYLNYRAIIEANRRKNYQQIYLKSSQRKRHSSTSHDDKYDPESVIDFHDHDSDEEYMKGMMNRNRNNLKRRIECRNELSDEERAEREAEDLARQKKRKSRWGEKVTDSDNASVNVIVSTSFANQNKPMLSNIQRTDPALLQYARLNYGTTNLSNEDWKKCEEHFKVNLLYQDMMRKRQEIDSLARSGKFKYEYDSDEDINGGTWEHKLRNAEMEATQAWAQALTKQSEGKHHIGDFLPPEELKKFMEQYEAKKNNRLPDLSDYKEYKLKEDNIGFQMLQKLGWKEGQGLGSEGLGIIDPVNKAPQRDGNQGLGVNNSATPEECDNEYEAYRKRMMLAYRFRPNPLNNPRRAYY